ncbi:MAG: hypothetical protein H0W50_03690 [Parachlamydiaceae bacterium]|nr:hypothetical protein [Parachlamydiaceae bacterium]
MNNLNERNQTNYSFGQFAVDLYSHECDDARTVMRIAQVNKYCYLESKSCKIWEEIRKIYNSSIEEDEQLRKHLFTDLTNVCWREKRTTIRVHTGSTNSKIGSYNFYNAGHIHFLQPDNLGVDQIIFIHAVSRSFYEKRLWLEVQKSLYNNNVKVLSPLDQEDKFSIHKQFSILGFDMKKLMINFPLEALKKNSLGHNYKYSIGSLCDNIYKSSQMVDNWNNLNKNNFHLAKIVELSSSDEQRLSAIPLELFQLTNLRKLKFDNTALDKLPPEIAQMTKLELIGLTRSSLSEFPKLFLNLTKLTSVHLGGNEIPSIPDEIRNLTKLKTLLLNSNQIRFVSKYICNLSLKSLNLQVNPIQFENLPKDISFPVRLSKSLVESTNDSNNLEEEELIPENENDNQLIKEVKEPLAQNQAFGFQHQQQQYDHLMTTNAQGFHMGGNFQQHTFPTQGFMQPGLHLQLPQFNPQPMIINHFYQPFYFNIPHLNIPQHSLNPQPMNFAPQNHQNNNFQPQPHFIPQPIILAPQIYQINNFQPQQQFFPRPMNEVQPIIQDNKRTQPYENDDRESKRKKD